VAKAYSHSTTCCGTGLWRSNHMCNTCNDNFNSKFTIFTSRCRLQQTTVRSSLPASSEWWLKFVRKHAKTLKTAMKNTKEFLSDYKISSVNMWLSKARWYLTDAMKCDWDFCTHHTVHCLTTTWMTYTVVRLTQISSNANTVIIQS